MPLQNRVAPNGQIHATPARGTMMGNRGGRIHDAAQHLGRARWRSRQWICCVLSFKNRQRQVMGDSYTELFFLDEVTALAAGHRPCFECRRADALAFASRFPGADRAPEIDRILHDARLDRPETAPLADQPTGTFARDGDALIALGHHGPLLWSFTGYTASHSDPTRTLEILTPAPTRAVLRAGYQPQWHPSALP